MAFSTMLPMISTSSCISRSRFSKSSRVMSAVFLAEAARDVILRAPVLRRREERVGEPELDEPPRAALIGQHERRVVRDARRLLHVVRDRDDGVIAREVRHQVL